MGVFFLFIYVYIYFTVNKTKKEERIEERAGGMNSGISFVCVST